MKKYIFFIMLILLVFLSFTALGRDGFAAAKDKKKVEDKAVQEGLNKKISLDLREIDILDLLKFLAKESDINIVVERDVTGKISMFINEITVKDAMDIAVSSNKLAYTVQGGVIKVMTGERYENIYGIKFNDRREVKSLRLNYAKPEMIISALDSIKSAIGKVIMDQATGSIILIDVPVKIKEMEDAIEVLDIPIETRMFTLKYADMESISKNLESFITANAGSMVLDTKTKTLIVTDYANKMKKIEEVIEHLDKKIKQVLIEAKIAKIELKNEFEMGIEWQNVLASVHGFELAGAFPMSTTSPSQTVKIGKIPQDDLSVTLRMLESVGKLDILSNPHITVRDGEEANIHVGQVIPVISETITTSEGVSTSTPSVEYKDVGIKLYVKPSITEDDFISMKIKPEISELLAFETTSNGNKFPKTETSEAETIVSVKDGVTIIIGGLMKNENRDTVKKVPFLGDIPFLGALFRSSIKAKIKSELVVFITPHIITGDRDIAKITDMQKVRKDKRDQDEEAIFKNRKPNRL